MAKKHDVTKAKTIKLVPGMVLHDHRDPLKDDCYSPAIRIPNRTGSASRDALVSDHGAAWPGSYIRLVEPRAVQANTYKSAERSDGWIVDVWHHGLTAPRLQVRPFDVRGGWMQYDAILDYHWHEQAGIDVLAWNLEIAQDPPPPNGSLMGLEQELYKELLDIERVEKGCRKRMQELKRRARHAAHA